MRVAVVISVGLATIAAAIFALHPLQVDTVAWVAERKNLLSGLFFMLTLWAYGGYANAEGRMPKAEGNPTLEIRTAEGSGQGLKGSDQTPDARNDQPTDHGSRPAPHASRFTFHASPFYLLALCFLALGLMCKPVLVTLPFVLLLLDYWPLRRLDGRQKADSGTTPGASRFAFHVSPATVRALLLEKLPFFALAAISCVVTMMSVQGVGSMQTDSRVPLDLRLENSVVSYVRYLGKTIWPFDLAIFYPYPAGWPIELVAGSGLLLLGVTALAVWWIGRRAWLFVGWFWFLGVLVPFIGLVQAGAQAIADRFMYLPLIGVLIPVVWGAAEVIGWLGWARKWTVAVVALILTLCAVRTTDQLRHWQDSEHLFQHALAVTQDNYMAHNNLAGDLYLRGRWDEAVEHYQVSLALQPRQPQQLNIRRAMGEALSNRGRCAEAAEQFAKVLEGRPGDVQALVQLGTARARQGKPDEAVQALSEALRIQPDNAAAHNSFGNVLAQQGRHEEAVRQFEEALRLQPDHAGARNNLAISCKALGRMNEAIAHYREALRAQPDSVEVLNNLAWILATQPDAKYRNGAEAVELANRAGELTRYQNPIPLVTLAAAYGEVGRFPEAISFAQQAQAIIGGGSSPLAARLQAMLGAFRAGQPYHGE